MNVFSKYAWVVPLKDKKGASIVNAFQKVLNNLSVGRAITRDVKQTKYGLIKGVNFTIVLLKNG